jgi:hypothetical protein
MAQLLSTPSKAEFMGTLETLQHCDLCRDPFSETHIPTRTKCDHIFGSTCLQAYIDSDDDDSNKCPKCHKVMFIDPIVPLSFMDGARPKDVDLCWVENIASYKDAKSLVHTLWINMSILNHHDGVVYDTDLEERISHALWTVAHDECYYDGVCIMSEHWPAVKDVAKAMMKWHHRRKDAFRSAMGHDWMEQVAVAVGWKWFSVEELVEHDMAEVSVT